MLLIEILKEELRGLKLDVLIARDRMRLAHARMLLARVRRSKLKLLRAYRARRPALYKDHHHLLVDTIGLLAMAWAHFEASLDGCISCIHHNGGKAIIQPDLPVSLKTKLAYLRKAPRAVVEIASLADDMNALCDQTQKLKIIRHDYLHGITTVDRKSLDFRTTRYVYDGPQLRLVQRTSTAKEAMDAVFELFRLDRLTIALMGKLGTTLQDKQTIEAFRKLQISLAAIPLEEEDAVRSLSD